MGKQDQKTPTHLRVGLDPIETAALQLIEAIEKELPVMGKARVQGEIDALKKALGPTVMEAVGPFYEDQTTAFLRHVREGNIGGKKICATCDGKRKYSTGFDCSDCHGEGWVESA